MKKLKIRNNKKELKEIKSADKILFKCVQNNEEPFSSINFIQIAKENKN